MNMRIVLLIIILQLVLGITGLLAQTGTISGNVIDRESKQPLIGANVIIEGTNLGAATDTDGKFSISTIPVNIYNLKFSYIGFETRIVTDVVVKSGKTIFVNTELQNKFIEGNEVVVTTGYFEKLDDSPISSQSLNSEEIRRSPGSREDVSRMIQNFPGVNPTSDDRNDLVIRGGCPSEVQFLIDDIEIPNPNHFGTQGATGGPIGMINTEFIDNVNFYSGGFTAGYGDKLSGVMDINLRNGNKESLSGKLDLNFGGAGGYIEGPLSGEKGSYLFSLHRSYMELFKEVLDMGGVPVYTNTQGKITYNFNPRQQISFLWLGGDDKIDIRYNMEVDDFEINKTDTNYYQNIDFKSRQLTIGSNLKSIWTNNFRTTLTISHTYSKYLTNVNEIDLVGFHKYDSNELSDKHEVSNKIGYSNSSVEQVYNLKFNADYIISKGVTLTAGSYAKRNVFNHNIRYIPPHPEKVNQYGKSPDSWDINMRINSANKYGGYSNLKLSLLVFLTLNTGIRIDYTELLNETSISPRFTLLCDITNDLSVHGGYGTYFQNPEFIWITIDKTNRFNLKDIKSEHVIFGLNYLITPSLKLTLEGYRKKYLDYPVADEEGYEMISMANAGADYGVSLVAQKLVSRGKGYAKGIDFMLQQKMNKSFYGIFSYSYSKTEHQALDGILRAGTFDNRNVLNFIFGYKMNKENEFSLKFKFAGGRPYTPFDINKSITVGDGILDLSKINSERYSDYQKLDLRYDNRDFLEWGTIIWYISVENILGKKNILTHYWNRAQQKTDFNYQTDLFFVGGVSLEF